ncbi:MAG: GGDEF domain-containing protein [Phycisphaerae bacterium]|jgi:diguanylate cyclase (GGDEF)-like protein
MQSRITINNENGNAQVLIVGGLNGDAIDTSNCPGVSFENCPGLSDAIAAAENNRFEVIAVPMDDFGNEPATALKKIRQIAPKSKILLLTQMWREPDAVRFLNANSNGTSLADDYYILPVSFYAKPSQTGQTHRSAPTAPVATAAAAESAEISAMRKRIEVLEKLAMEDELTGVKNRRFVKEFLRQIIERANKMSLQVTLLVFDIDNFKNYNDRFGHPVGDNILKQAAVLMQKCCRKQDVVGRVGGDEFAVVFWNIPQNKVISFDAENQQDRRSVVSEHPREVINICERFRSELNNTDLPALGAEGKGILAISGGLATFPHDGLTVEQLFLQADNGLLEAKRSGKNRVYLIASKDAKK